MIKRYSTDELTAIKEFFIDDEFEYIILCTGIQSSDMLYFDIWLSLDNLGITSVIFRSYGNFYLKYNPRADLNEISNFIGFLPMLDSICLSLQSFDDFACLLNGIKGVRNIKIAKQTDKSLLQSHDLFYKQTEVASDYRSVYTLLKHLEQMPSFDDYYFLRKSYSKNKAGRTYFLESGDKVYSTASTTGEIEEYALITDVATDEAFQKKGLASAIVSKLCLDLLENGKTPLVAYSDPAAKRLYDKLGFTEIGERVVVRFK